MTDQTTASDEEHQRIERLRRALATAQGARREVLSRIEALRREVAMAKGRLALKSDVDVFLEEMQADAHRRNVGSFERLLTVLVQDVLPGSPPVGLELSTERGLPSLDIFSRRPDGNREDIYADQGGSVTNVVSTGLRIIAAVKSGGRLFLVLDEPDCWIAPERIPDFYRVLRQAAERLGVQCLVISHHSRALFGEGIAVARLTSNDGKAMIESAPGIELMWHDDTPGIRAVRLDHFQAHEHSELKLAPGVTALIGPNDRGKSSVVRALSAMFYGNARDALISHAEKSCRVEIDIENGRRISFTRERKRNPVNVWTMSGSDGQIIEENGLRYETGGRAVPDWMAAQSGIAPIDELEINVSNQKEPVFLLGEPPAKRASVLSVGQETSHLREMIEIQRARSVRDQQTVRDGEREITTLETRAAHLASVDDIVVIVDRAETLFNEAEDGRRKGERLNGLLQSIEETAALIEKAKARKVILDSIPSEADRDRLVSEIMKSAARSDLLQRIETASREVTAARSRLAILAKLPDPPVLTPSDRIATLVDAAEMAGSNLAWLRKRLEILATIPDAPPVLESSDRVIEIGVAIRKAQDALTPAKARLAEIDGEIKEVEKNTAALLAEMGNLCPTCGQTVDDGAAFLHHGHHADGSSPEDRT